MLEVILPGTGGTVPRKDRWLATCLMRREGVAVMIDCGEGTQIALKEAGLTMKPIGVLCLTHYHADHVSGLPGFLLTMGNEGRTEPLTVIGPTGLSAVLRGLLVIAPLSFELHLIEFDDSLLSRMKKEGQAFCVSGYRITPFPLNHGVPCYGYRVEVPRVGKFDPKKARENRVPLPAWSLLQKVPEVEIDGVRYTREMVLGAPRRGLKVVYATDTRPVGAIAEEAEDADLLICEGMYGDPEKQERANEAGHMLYRDAARLAKSARARRLWLTHYSPSMKEPAEFLSEATSVFPGALCAEDGMRTVLRFSEEGDSPLTPPGAL